MVEHTDPVYVLRCMKSETVEPGRGRIAVHGSMLLAKAPATYIHGRDNGEPDVKRLSLG